MPHPFKRAAPNKPSKKMIQAAINMQAPTDAPQPAYARKKSVLRDWDESVTDIGTNDKAEQKP